MWSRPSCLLVLALLTGSTAYAQGFPSRAVRVVVPFPPGGPTDVLVRALGERLSAQLRQPVVVENRPGANTIIGAEQVSRAPADGHTLLLATDATYSINPLLYKKLPYAPKTDLVPVSIVAHAPAVLMVRSGLGLKTFGDLVAYAKAHPGKLSYGSFGKGSSPHLAGEALSRTAGIRLLHVPYKGAAEVLPAMLSQQIDLVVTSPVQAMPFIASGAIQPLATPSPKRMAQLPDVPTYQELGLGGLETYVWFGLMAPAGTPAGTLNLLATTVDAIVGAADFQEKTLRSVGMEAPPAGGRTEYFRRVLLADESRYAKFVKEAGVAPE